jgi:lysophospholipase L1-like esterase
MIFFRRAFKLSFILIINLCVALGLLEIVGRTFDPFGVSYYPEMARYLDTLVMEEPIGYRNRQGLTGSYFGATVRINSLGLRDKEIPKKSNSFRILFLGDSVPFGIGVEQEETLPSQLEFIANGAAERDSAFDVINMGVPSYNTEQELIQLKTIGLDLNPDLVVLLFSRNDIEPKMWVFEKRTGLVNNIIQRSYAGSLLFLAYRESRIRFPRLINSARASAKIEDEITNAFRGYQADFDRWQTVLNSLVEINSLLRKKGIPFVVFLKNENRALFNLLKKHSPREDNFHLFNLNAWKDPRWIGSDIRKYVNSVTDGHPNTDGTTILATLIHEALVEARLVNTNSKSAMNDRFYALE